MTTFPREIHRGADGYFTMRLESYDLSVDQWREWLRARGAKYSQLEWMSISIGGGKEVGACVGLQPDGELMFSSVCDGGSLIDHDSAAEAMAYHELLANDIVERIETMEQLGVDALMDGAL